MELRMGDEQMFSMRKRPITRAKRNKEAQDVQRFLEPFSSLDDVVQSPLLRFFTKAGVLLFVMNAVALGGQIGAAVTHNDNLIWIQILAFVIGVNFGSHAIFSSSNLLDVKRWRVSWRLDILGYVLGYCLFSFITAMLRAASVAHRTPLTSIQGTIAQLSIILPALVGVAFAALVVAATDTRRKAWVAKKWSELHREGADVQR